MEGTSWGASALPVVLIFQEEILSENSPFFHYRLSPVKHSSGMQSSYHRHCSSLEVLAKSSLAVIIAWNSTTGCNVSQAQDFQRLTSWLSFPVEKSKVVHCIFSCFQGFVSGLSLMKSLGRQGVNLEIWVGFNDIQNLPHPFRTT